MSEQSRPVVDRPDSVTHWTCPEAPVEGATHHLNYRGVCVYCRKGTPELQKEQAAILQRDREIMASNAAESKFFEQNPRVPAEPDWDDLTTKEQREALAVVFREHGVTAEGADTSTLYEQLAEAILHTIDHGGR